MEIIMDKKEKSIGIITEYNPFHNGHKYHIEMAQKLTGAKKIICVMSGDYVQRGEPALIDKFTRARTGVNNGVSLILELPVTISLSSAEGFASGAVRILAQAGADYLVFGSECGDIDKLTTLARFLCNETDSFKSLLKSQLAKGISFPTAREFAVISELGSEYADILSSPNNILGIEYIKAIIKGGYSITPVTVSRMGAGYNCENINEHIPSASAIRKFIKENDTPLIDKTFDIDKNLPADTHDVLKKAKETNSYLELNDYTSLFRTRIRDIMYKCQLENPVNSKDLFCKYLCEYEDIDSALANRLFSLDYSHMSLEQLCENLKTKQYTLSRVKRCIMRLCLNIKTTDISEKTPYIRILAFDRRGQEHLSYLKKNSEAVIINKVADYRQLLYRDIYCSDIYRQLIYDKSGIILDNDYTHNIYIKKFNRR